MQRKWVIVTTDLSEDQFLVFLVDKKGQVLTLKNLNSFTPYIHFKMESLNFVRDLLQTGDHLIKLDLKDAYFSAPLSRLSRKFVRFQRKYVSLRREYKPLQWSYRYKGDNSRNAIEVDRKTALAVLPAPLNYRFSQDQQNKASKEQGFFKSKVCLSILTILELRWWVENLRFCNGCSLLSSTPELHTTDRPWGTGGSWTIKERKSHNKYTIALKYFMKMGSTQNQEMVIISKEIWNSLLK